MTATLPGFKRPIGAKSCCAENAAVSWDPKSAVRGGAVTPSARLKQAAVWAGPANERRELLVRGMAWAWVAKKALPTSYQGG
jgi:hypothetical protein